MCRYVATSSVFKFDSAGLHGDLFDVASRRRLAAPGSGLALVCSWADGRTAVMCSM